MRRYIEHIKNTRTTHQRRQHALQVAGGITAASFAAAAITSTVAPNLDAAITSRMATYTQPTGFLAATFPSGTIANTTNITAGTITTVTNLTNAPTAGDFTATMKTSLNAATPTIGSVTLAASQPNYAPSKAGDQMDLVNAPNATALNAAATALLDLANAIDSGGAGDTLRHAMRLTVAAAAAKLSGASTTTNTIRDTADTKDRITATVDASGNRTAVTYNVT